MRKLFDFLLLNVETEKTKKSTQRLVVGISFFLCVCAAIMSILNGFSDNQRMFISTLILSISLFVCGLVCCIRYSKAFAASFMGIIIILFFSFFLLIGGNNGFAIDWILLVPVAYMAVFGLMGAIFVGGYFWLFLVICFWTPLSQFIPYTYSDEVRLRFPILYSCCFFLAIIIGVINKKLLCVQKQGESTLLTAVADERSRVEKISIDAISSICNALDAKDTYTKEHSDHVAAYSCCIAKELGWNNERIELLNRAARVHDLGKIGVPDYILNKTGRLTDEEMEIMKEHVVTGAGIVAELTTMPELLVGTKYHHERYDGKGYAEGIKGEDIPIEGRIIALSDAIDAMSSNRVYRKKLSKDTLISELQKGSGTQFDPSLVAIALNLIDKGVLEQVCNEHRVNHHLF